MPPLKKSKMASSRCFPSMMAYGSFWRLSAESPQVKSAMYTFGTSNPFKMESMRYCLSVADQRPPRLWYGGSMSILSLRFRHHVRVCGSIGSTLKSFLIVSSILVLELKISLNLPRQAVQVRKDDGFSNAIPEN